MFCKFAAWDARARFADVRVSGLANPNLQICKLAGMNNCKFAPWPVSMLNASEQSICKSRIPEGTASLQILDLAIVQACKLASPRIFKLQ